MLRNEILSERIENICSGQLHSRYAGILEDVTSRGILSVPPTMIPVVKASPIAEKILDETLKILSQS